ncbi:MAG TPA: hypothetical protein DEQ28_06425, partial [Clostridiales bacterium]|nr:hypothetical protein [Clostridiales bacterium]
KFLTIESYRNEAAKALVHLLSRPASLHSVPEVLPLAWEPVGGGGRAVIFENAGPFAVARRALAELPERPYDLVVYGGGRSLPASLRHLLTIGRRIESLDCVGDLDEPGLVIAVAVRDVARDVGLPEVKPAEKLYWAMLRAAAELGYPAGWPAGEGRRGTADRARELVRGLSPNLAERIAAMLVSGRRVPEEVLGAREMTEVWRS